ncbi:MAG: aldolase/citrate lyase family protein [Cytophagales bacterium]|nr:aldolase/citrate lyase family protein [Bernardetiaceae bacterium]MDW8210242.1 aldolase/citrate lyase family protein [Cytophagales bacterium]
MKINPVKSKIQQGQAAIGVISNFSDPMVAEICAYAGLDFYIIDAEHGAITPAEALPIIRACQAAGIAPMARIRSIDPKLILQFLDAGIVGVMMPGVSTAAQVEALVKAVKYPPEGERGLGPVRAWEFGIGPMSQADYIRFANQQILVLPQIEDLKAVENLPQMCNVAGIDGFIIGPRDLAMSMGYYDGPNHPAVQQTIDRIIEIVLAHHLVIGTTAGNAEQAKALISKGAKIIMHYTGAMLGAAAKAFAAAGK